MNQEPESSPTSIQSSSSSYTEDEDGLLLLRLHSGEQAAFITLFQKYVQRIYQQAIKLLRDPAEAEDTVQEVFLKVLEKGNTFRGEAAFSTWLHRVVLNAALGRLRKRAREELLPEEGEADAFMPKFREDGHHLTRPVVDWSETPEEQCSRKEMAEHIRVALDGLNPLDRAVTVLSEFEALSDKEISESLGLTVSAVKSRLHRARQFLRGKLAEALGHSSN